MLQNYHKTQILPCIFIYRQKIVKDIFNILLFLYPYIISVLLRKINLFYRVCATIKKPIILFHFQDLVLHLWFTLRGFPKCRCHPFGP